MCLYIVHFEFMPMNLSEPLHFTNQVRKGGALSPYLFAACFDDLFLELNNIKARCCMVEILLNDLMFADDICVFWTSVRGLQSILDVCQACAESNEIIFDRSKTVCMMFKAKTAKSTVIPLLTVGVQKVKSVSHYKYLGIVRDTELSDDKDIQTQLRYQKLLFPDVRAQWQTYFFVPSVRPCTHHNYGVISGRHTSTDCLWLITLVAGHCTTCRSERVLVVIMFNTTFLPLRLYWKKRYTFFLNYAESLTTYGCPLWCSQIVYIRTYSFNNTTAFYFVTEGPGVLVLVWGRVHCAGHNAFVLHLALARVETLFLNMRFSCPTLDVVFNKASKLQATFWPTFAENNYWKCIQIYLLLFVFCWHVRFP